jgi:hypothetical protein
MRTTALRALQIGALLLALAGCLMVVAHEITTSRPPREPHLVYRPPQTSRVHPARTPRPKPLHRSHLDGYWSAVGYVVTGDGKLYAQHTRLDRRWFFFHTCKSLKCPLAFARSSTSGLLAARLHGSRPLWTATFPRYGVLMCGAATHRVPTRMSSKWRFHLASTQLEATEIVTSAPICRASPVEIEWLARPLALPSAPQVDAPHVS